MFCKYNVSTMSIVVRRSKFTFCFLELSGIFFLNMSDLWLVESADSEPVDLEGWLNRMLKDISQHRGAIPCHRAQPRHHGNIWGCCRVPLALSMSQRLTGDRAPIYLVVRCTNTLGRKLERSGILWFTFCYGTQIRKGEEVSKIYCQGC